VRSEKIKESAAVPASPKTSYGFSARINKPTGNTGVTDSSIIDEQSHVQPSKKIDTSTTASFVPSEKIKESAAVPPSPKTSYGFSARINRPTGNTGVTDSSIIDEQSHVQPSEESGASAIAPLEQPKMTNEKQEAGNTPATDSSIIFEQSHVQPIKDSEVSAVAPFLRSEKINERAAAPSIPKTSYGFSSRVVTRPPTVSSIALPEATTEIQSEAEVADPSDSVEGSAIVDATVIETEGEAQMSLATISSSKDQQEGPIVIRDINNLKTVISVEITAVRKRLSQLNTLYDSFTASLLSKNVLIHSPSKTLDQMKDVRTKITEQVIVLSLLSLSLLTLLSISRTLPL
jgi:hypothetical protein